MEMETEERCDGNENRRKTKSEGVWFGDGGGNGVGLLLLPLLRLSSSTPARAACERRGRGPRWPVEIVGICRKKPKKQTDRWRRGDRETYTAVAVLGFGTRVMI